MGNSQINIPKNNKKIDGEQKGNQKLNECKTRHCDSSSDYDCDEMDDKFNDNSATKGCRAKNKAKIDDCKQTKVSFNIDRNLRKTNINNSI